MTVLALGSACTNGAEPSGSPSPAPSGPATGSTSGPTPAQDVRVTAGGEVAGLPARYTLYPRAGAVEAVAAFGTWVVWSEVSAPASTAPPGTRVPDRVVAFDTRTQRTVVVPRHAPGAIPNLSTGTGDWLIDREITPRPPAECGGDSPTGCFRWRIWAVDLASGREHVLAESTRSAPQPDNPIPVAGGDAVAWQEVDAEGAVRTVVDRPAGGARRVAATGPASSQLSIDAGTLYLDDGRTDPPRLLRVPVAGGQVAPVVTGVKFYRPRAASGEVTLVAGIPTEGMRVLLAPATDLAKRREVFRSNEVYNAWPLGGGAALVFDFLGLHRVTAGAAPRHLPVEVASPGDVAVSGSTLALATGDASGAVTIRVLDLAR